MSWDEVVERVLPCVVQIETPLSSSSLSNILISVSPFLSNLIHDYLLDKFYSTCNTVPVGRLNNDTISVSQKVAELGCIRR